MDRHDSRVDRDVYVESLLTRLRRQYVERTSLPPPVPEPEWVAESGESLSFAMLRRLCQCVLSEGYGEQ